MSLAHGFRNYEVITATVRETTHAEDHIMRNRLDKLILYSYIYKEKYISLLCERYTFSHINRI